MKEPAHFNCIALRNTLKNIRHSNLIKIALCARKKIQIHMQIRGGVGPEGVSAFMLNELTSVLSIRVKTMRRMRNPQASTLREHCEMSAGKFEDARKCEINQLV